MKNSQENLFICTKCQKSYKSYPSACNHVGKKHLPYNLCKDVKNKDYIQCPNLFKQAISGTPGRPRNNELKRSRQVSQTDQLQQKDQQLQKFVENLDKEATEKVNQEILESCRVDNDFLGVDNILLWTTELENNLIGETQDITKSLTDQNSDFQKIVQKIQIFKENNVLINDVIKLSQQIQQDPQYFNQERFKKDKFKIPQFRIKKFIFFIKYQIQQSYESLKQVFAHMLSVISFYFKPNGFEQISLVILYLFLQLKDKSPDSVDEKSVNEAKNKILDEWKTYLINKNNHKQLKKCKYSLLNSDNEYKENILNIQFLIEFVIQIIQEMKGEKIANEELVFEKKSSKKRNN